ncbi:MAG: hypothetical protein V1702_00295 [Candidatus Woesearchaeota archaeon]
MQILPKTRLGKWSACLLLAFLLLIGVVALVVALGQRGPEFNPIIGVPMILAMVSGVSAFFTGIISIIKYKERAVIVFITSLIGLYLLFMLVGEFTVPH